MINFSNSIKCFLNKHRITTLDSLISVYRIQHSFVYIVEEIVRTKGTIFPKQRDISLFSSNTFKHPLKYGNFEVRKHGHGSIFARIIRVCIILSTFRFLDFHFERIWCETTTSKDALIMRTFTEKHAIKLCEELPNIRVIDMEIETSFKIRVFTRVSNWI